MADITSGGYTGTRKEAALAKLVREAELAKLEKVKDRFNLPPVEKGFLRGRAINVRQSEQPCEFGILQVVEFDVSDTREGPGVPVRMAGIQFTQRLWEGMLVDVPDPTPAVRPITPTVVYNAHNHDAGQVQAYYPGRGQTTPRTSLVLGLLGILVPVVVTAGIIWALYVFHIV